MPTLPIKRSSSFSSCWGVQNWNIGFRTFLSIIDSVNLATLMYPSSEFFRIPEDDTKNHFLKFADACRTLMRCVLCSFRQRTWRRWEFLPKLKTCDHMFFRFLFLRLRKIRKHPALWKQNDFFLLVIVGKADWTAGFCARLGGRWAWIPRVRMLHPPNHWQESN